MGPFGFVDDGTPDELQSEVDEYGTVWHLRSAKRTVNPVSYKYH